MGGGSASRLSLPPIAAILPGANWIAEGGVLIKMFLPNPPMLANAIGMTVGGVILAAASKIRGEPWSVPAQTTTWLAFLYLVVCVTILALLIYMFVLGKWSASGRSYGFVMIPPVTMVEATVLAGELITTNSLLGGERSCLQACWSGPCCPPWQRRRRSRSARTAPARHCRAASNRCCRGALTSAVGGNDWFASGIGARHRRSGIRGGIGHLTLPGARGTPNGWDYAASPLWRQAVQTSTV
jgi:hypothetical protein